MFGNQLVEGLMRGCHGIVADNTALAENVKRFGNGTIIRQKNSNNLAKAVMDILSNPPCVEIIESARRNIRNYMSPDAVAVAHARIYENVLKASCIYE